MALLSVRNVTRRFGGIVAIDDVSLEAETGQIVGLIGPNGAGKTTLFNVITRLYRPDSGELDFDATTGEAPGPIEIWGVSASGDDFVTESVVLPK